MERLATDVLDRLDVGPVLRWVGADLRRRLSRLATDDEVLDLAWAGRTGTRAVLPAGRGSVVTVGGLAVATVSAPRTGEVMAAVAGGRLVEAAFLLAALVRAGQVGVGATLAAVGSELIGHPTAPRARVAHLLARIATERGLDELAGQLPGAGAAVDLETCRQALCGLPRWPVDAHLCHRLLLQLTAEGGLDPERRRLLELVVSVPVGQAALDVDRDLLTRNCIENALTGTLEALLDASADHPDQSVRLGSSVLVAAQSRAPDALALCLARLEAAPLAAPAARADPLANPLAEALRAAAELDDVDSCQLLLSRVDRAGVADALVACCRADRRRAARVLAREADGPAIDAALEIATHWGFRAVVAELLECRPSASGLAEGLWLASFRGDDTVVTALRERLRLHWAAEPGTVQRGLDRALDAAGAVGSSAVARGLIGGDGPSPSASAQGAVLRQACSSGDQPMIRALLTEPLTRAMNLVTLNGCFVDSARRHDLATVRAMLPLVRPPAMGEALERAMCARDVDMTVVLLTEGRPSTDAVERALCAALVSGAAESVTVVSELACSVAIGVTAEAATRALAGAVVDAADRTLLASVGAPAVRGLVAALNSPLRTSLVQSPGVWRRALTALATLQLDQQLERLVGLLDRPDEEDRVAVRDAVMLALRRNSSSTFMALRPAFVEAARPDDVDAAFMMAVAYRSVVNLQLLGRDFAPSRDSLRRCRMLIKDERRDDLARVLSRLQRGSPSQARPQNASP